MAQSRKILLLDDSNDHHLDTLIKVSNSEQLTYYPKSYPQLYDPKGRSYDFNKRVEQWKKMLDIFLGQDPEDFDRYPDYTCVNLHLGEVSSSSSRLSNKEVDIICKYLENHARCKDIPDRNFLIVYKAADYKQYRIAFWIVIIANYYKLNVSLIINKQKDFNIESRLGIPSITRFIIHVNDFNPDNLIKYVSPSINLEDFWRKTDLVNWHRSEQTKIDFKNFVDFKNFTGLNPDGIGWLNGLKGASNRAKEELLDECRHGLSGIHSCASSIEKGSSHLTLLGSFFILQSVLNRTYNSKSNLNVSYSRPKKKDGTYKFIKHDGYGYLTKVVFPMQSQSIAKTSMMLLEILFEQIIFYENTRELSISSLNFDEKGMEIVLKDFNIFNTSTGRESDKTILEKLYNANKSILQDTDYLSTICNSHIFPKIDYSEPGQLTKTIIAFNQFANVQDRNLKNIPLSEEEIFYPENIIFPQNNGIEFYYHDNTTVLRLKLHHRLARYESAQIIVH
jgi:hypothetical protein